MICLNDLFLGICLTKMLSHNFTALFARTIGWITINYSQSTIHNITRFFLVTINVTWSRDLSRMCKIVWSDHNKSVRVMVTTPRTSDTADPAPALLKGPTGLH